MNKLLNAGFARLWKDKLFWIGMAFMLLCSDIMVLNTYRQVWGGRWSQLEDYALDNYFFQYGVLIGVVCAVFISLFVGTDYSDGTIRNKIAAGHTRKDIYLSNLIVCTVAGWLMVTAWLVSMVTAGRGLLGWVKNLDNTALVIWILISLLMVLALTSIYLAVVMLCQNKAYAAVIILLVWLVLLFIASYCENRLSEPEMYRTAMHVTVEGGVELSEPAYNPAYVSGNLRVLLTFVRDFLPVGQGIMLSNMEVENVWLLPVYSVVIVVLTTWAGIRLFQKKDIK